MAGALQKQQETSAVGIRADSVSHNLKNVLNGVKNLAQERLVARLQRGGVHKLQPRHGVKAAAEFLFFDQQEVSGSSGMQPSAQLSRSRCFMYWENTVLFVRFALFC